MVLLSTPLVVAYAVRCVRAAPDRGFAVIACIVACLEGVWMAWKLGRYFLP